MRNKYHPVTHIILFATYLTAGILALAMARWVWFFSGLIAP